MTDLDSILDSFAELADDELNGEDDELCSFEPAEDAAIDERIEAALAHHAPLFTRHGSTWTAMPTRLGCNHAEVTVTRANGTVTVRADCGVRVPEDRRLEARKFVLLANRGFRVSGFDPLLPDGAVVFSFAVEEDILEREMDEDDTLLPRTGEAPLRTDPRDGERSSAADGNVLDVCLGLAVSTLLVYTSRFNEIAYGGKDALEVDDD